MSNFIGIKINTKCPISQQRAPDYADETLCFFISKHIFLPQHQRRYEGQHETEKGDRGKSDLA